MLFSLSLRLTQKHDELPLILSEHAPDGQRHRHDGGFSRAPERFHDKERDVVALAKREHLPVKVRKWKLGVMRKVGCTKHEVACPSDRNAGLVIR